MKDIQALRWLLTIFNCCFQWWCWPNHLILRITMRMLTKSLLTVQSSTISGCFSCPSDPIGERTKAEPFASFQNTTRLLVLSPFIITLYRAHSHRLSRPGSWSFASCQFSRQEWSLFLITWWSNLQPRRSQKGWFRLRLLAKWRFSPIGYLGVVTNIDADAKFADNS